MKNRLILLGDNINKYLILDSRYHLSWNPMVDCPWRRLTGEAEYKIISTHMHIAHMKEQSWTSRNEANLSSKSRIRRLYSNYRLGMLMGYP